MRKFKREDTTTILIAKVVYFTGFIITTLLGGFFYWIDKVIPYVALGVYGFLLVSYLLAMGLMALFSTNLHTSVNDDYWYELRYETWDFLGQLIVLEFVLSTISNSFDNKK